MIVGPIPAQMDDFCDLHGTPDTPVSRIVTVKAHSLSKKFCTMICFSKNEQLMSALAGWKGLVRMICFSKNEDRADSFTQ